MLLRNSGSFFPYQKTVAAWWLWGKEHREISPLSDYGLRKNPPGLVEQVLDRKIAAYRQEPVQDWRFYQVEEALIVERQRLPVSLYYETERTRNYYLVNHGLVVQEHCRFARGWTWKLHLADIYFDAARQSWIMKDLLVNLLVHPNSLSHLVTDLDALGEALAIGLLTPGQAAEILQRVQQLSRQIDENCFPFPEIILARQACRRLGWD